MTEQELTRRIEELHKEYALFGRMRRWERFTARQHKARAQHLSEMAQRNLLPWEMLVLLPGDLWPTQRDMLRRKYERQQKGER